MNYRSIDEANLADSAAHLKDAIRKGRQAHIRTAARKLQEQIKIIEPMNPKLCAAYKDLIQGIELDE